MPLQPGERCPGSPCPYLMVWLMMMGSGCCRSPASFMGISEKRMRTQLKIWRDKAERLLSRAGPGAPLGITQPWFAVVTSQSFVQHIHQ